MPDSKFADQPPKKAATRQLTGYLGFVALLLLIVLGASYSLVVYHTLRDQAEKENLAAQAAQAEMGAEYISDHLKWQLGLLGAISSRNSFRHALEAKNLEELRNFLLPLLSLDQDLHSVFVSSPTGRILIQVPEAGKREAGKYSLSFDNPRPWVSAVSPEAGGRGLVTLSVPVWTGDGKLAGFLGLGQPANIWRDFFSRLSARPGRTYFLFDQQGGLIASGIQADSHLYKKLLPISQSIRNQLSKPGSKGSRLVQSHVEKHQAFVASKQVSASGWVLVVAQDYDAGMASTRVVFVNMLIFLILLFCCLVAVGLLLWKDFRTQRRLVTSLDAQTQELETQVVRGTQDLARSHERYHSLVQDLPDMIYELDAQGRMVFVSKSVHNILGYRPDEMIGRPRRDFVLAQDLHKWDEERRRAEKGEEMSDLTLRHRTKKGGVRWLSIHSRGLFDEQGRLTGRRGVGRDITQQVMAESRIHQLSRKLIRAQEEERKGIALDLHDEMGQLLSALKLGLQSLAQRLEPQFRQEGNKLVRLAQTIVDRMRALAYRLRPATLDNFGLRAAVEDLCETLAESHLVAVEHNLGIFKEESLSPEVTISVFRLVQEALTNAVKHSGSPKVRVDLFTQDNILNVKISDFGRGFEVDKALHEGRKLGLWGMRERINLIGGELKIDSSPQGTVLWAQVPVEGRNKKHASGSDL
jgi:PAS domain S-box-containing protein